MSAGAARWVVLLSRPGRRAPGSDTLPSVDDAIIVVGRVTAPHLAGVIAAGGGAGPPDRAGHETPAHRLHLLGGRADPLPPPTPSPPVPPPPPPPPPPH